ncbi:MAG: DNA-packaging protein [Clostridium sp.]|nr:DNA-packaging protein [Clostridium sp.]
MKNEEKPSGRGQYMVRAWEEAKKSGGLSYSPEQIQAILEERDDEMLTREEVKNRISAYLQNCLTVSQDEETQEINYVWKRNPTKSGLALALGVSPQTVIDYVKGSDRRGNKYKTGGENKGVQKVATADFDLIRKAYILIEDFYEQKLGDNRNNAGVIFWLNNKENTRWSNEQEFKFGMAEPEEKEMISGDELPRLIAEKYGTTVEEMENTPFPEPPSMEESEVKQNEL